MSLRLLQFRIYALHFAAKTESMSSVDLSHEWRQSLSPKFSRKSIKPSPPPHHKRYKLGRVVGIVEVRHGHKFCWLQSILGEMKGVKFPTSHIIIPWLRSPTCENVTIFWPAVFLLQTEILCIQMQNKAGRTSTYTELDTPAGYSFTSKAAV